jgi:hypothetical protein
MTDAAAEHASFATGARAVPARPRTIEGVVAFVLGLPAAVAFLGACVWAISAN